MDNYNVGCRDWLGLFPCCGFTRGDCIFKMHVWGCLQDYGVVFVLGAFAMLPITKKYRSLCETYVVCQKVSNVLEPLACGVILVIGIAYTVSSTYNPFIYFNF